MAPIGGTGTAGRRLSGDDGGAVAVRLRARDTILTRDRRASVPDHTTIARFGQRHQDALAALFGDVLALCAEAGLVDAGVIAVDATKVHANAFGAGDVWL